MLQCTVTLYVCVYIYIYIYMRISLSLNKYIYIYIQTFDNSNTILPYSLAVLLQGVVDEQLVEA